MCRGDSSRIFNRKKKFLRTEKKSAEPAIKFAVSKMEGSGYCKLLARDCQWLPAEPKN